MARVTATGTDEAAFLEVRVLPWRPRARVMKADTLRDGTPDLLQMGGDSLKGLVLGLVLGLALWLLIIVAAPVIVVVLAVLLLPVELVVVAVLALVLVAVRFTGVVPWNVLVLEPQSGAERRERSRALWRAVGRVREVNGERRVRVRVRWAWA